MTHTPSAGERIARNYFGIRQEDARIMKCLANDIDTAIAEAQKPVKVNLEECAKVCAGTEMKHNDYNYLPDATVIAKAVIESLIKQGVKVYVE